MDPDMQILLMYIIPVKMKWMAVIYGILTVAQFLEGNWQSALRL